MENSQRESRMITLFGDAPRSNAEYRLPVFALGLAAITALSLLSQERGLDALLAPAAFAFGTLQALGDRVWSRSREAASWLRLSGISVIFTAVGLLVLHYYIEQQTGWLIFALAGFFIALLWAFSDAFIRLRNSPRAPG